MTNPPKIAVSGRNYARRKKRKFEALLTIQDIAVRHPIRFHSNPHPPHLRLSFEDYDGPHAAIPGPLINHAEQIIAFCAEHSDKRLLIHCNAGISRSTASALGGFCLHFKHDIQAAWDELKKIRPEAAPNRQLVSHIDGLLGYDGALSAFVENRFAMDPGWQWRQKMTNDIIHKEFPHLID